MPVYNAEKYLESAISSVLSQSYSNFELLIIDDCSTDNSARIIKSFDDRRIHYISLEANKGVANARNIGLDKSNGAYVAFCDSDDVWLKDKLNMEINLLEKSEASLAFTAYEMIDADGERIKFVSIPEKVCFEDLLKENMIIFSTVVCKKDILKGMRFQKEWYHEDYIFLLDLLQRGYNFIGVDQICAKYRVHGAGRSFNKLNAAKHRWRIYREYLKLGIVDSILFFCDYAINGMRKYT